MTVEIDDKRRKGERIPGLGVSNGTWFAILDIPGVEKIIPTIKTNDPINASPAAAKRLAKLIEGWTPPENWYSGIGPEKGKEYFLEFLRNCNGFRTM